MAASISKRPMTPTFGTRSKARAKSRPKRQIGLQTSNHFPDIPFSREVGTRKPHLLLRQRLIKFHSFPLRRKIAPKSHARQVSQASTFPTSPNSGTPQAPDIPSSPRNGIPDPPVIPTSPDYGILQPTVESTNRHVRPLRSARPLSRGNVKDSRKPRYSALMNIN